MNFQVERVHTAAWNNSPLHRVPADKHDLCQSSQILIEQITQSNMLRKYTSVCSSLRSNLQHHNVWTYYGLLLTQKSTQKECAHFKHPTTTVTCCKIPGNQFIQTSQPLRFRWHHKSSSTGESALQQGLSVVHKLFKLLRQPASLTYYIYHVMQISINTLYININI